MDTKRLLATTKAVLQVRTGRGFVIKRRDAFGLPVRLTITAGHCLPKLPISWPCYQGDRLCYRNLLGPLGKKAKVMAELLFADPVSDLAVLGCPDNQAHPESDDYEQLTDSMKTLTIGQPELAGEAWLLSLKNEWFKARYEVHGGPVWLCEGEQPIQGGMSGSPVLDRHGRAIALVNMGSYDDQRITNEPQVTLISSLPGWLVRNYKFETLLRKKREEEIHAFQARHKSR